MEVSPELMCRLCLSTVGIMETIFDDTNKTISDKIFECTAIEMENLSGLPTSVCNFCKSKLNLAYSFRKQCIDSHILLMQKYKEMVNSGKIILDKNSKTPKLEKPQNDIKKEDAEYLEIETLDEDFQMPDKIDDELIEIIDEEYSDNNDIIKANAASEIKNEINVVQRVSNRLSSRCKTEQSKSITIEAKKVLPSKSTAKRKHHIIKKKTTSPIVETRKLGTQVCQVCGAVVKSLRQHMLSHGEKKFQCSYCPKKFTQKGALNYHINTHTGEKPFVCKECGASFVSPNSLSSHLISHTTGSKYKCNECDKFFRFSHGLAVHRRSHTDERNYKCNICQYKFLRKQSLTKHLRVHTGERPYSCTKCSSKFKSNSNLKSHLKTHEKDNKLINVKIIHESFEKIDDIIDMENQDTIEMDNFL